MALQGILDMEKCQVRARGSQPRSQGDSADQDGLNTRASCEAAIQHSEKTDTNLNVRMLCSRGDKISLPDSVSVISVASFLSKVAVEGLFVQDAVVVAD